jgi:DNA-binding transcriptional LysR family regulator
LDLAEHNSAILLRLLLDRTIDVACMNIPEYGWDAPLGVCHAPIFRFELVFAVHVGHRLQKLEQVPLEDIVSEPMIMPPNSSVYWIVDHAFRTRGLAHSIRFHITDQHTLLEMAAEGIGVGVSTRFAISQYPELSLHMVEAADAQLKGIGVAAWTERGIRNKAIQVLVNHAQAWPRTAHWPGQSPVFRPADQR